MALAQRLAQDTDFAPFDHTGRSGVVAKYDVARRRVGVEFGRQHGGLLSLRPANLDLDPEARRRELMREKPHPQPRRTQ